MNVNVHFQTDPRILEALRASALGKVDDVLKIVEEIEQEK
jgi:hypothetical protein